MAVFHTKEQKKHSVAIATTLLYNVNIYTGIITDNVSLSGQT